MNPIAREIKEIKWFIKQVKQSRSKTVWLIESTHGYLAWDYEQVWRWTKTLSRAARFPTRDAADRAAKSTMMSMRFRYHLTETPR